MRCGLLPGGVFRGTAIRYVEAEGLADFYLRADERGDDLHLSGVIDAIHCHQKVNSYHLNTDRESSGMSTRSGSSELR